MAEDKSAAELPEQNADLQDDPLNAEAGAEPVLEDIFNLQDEIERLQDERNEYKDRMVRAMADAENVRKRGERERRDAEVYGGTRLARDILPIFDNLNRAMDVIDDKVREAAPGLIEGIELTRKELISAFEKNKIYLLNPEFGEKFDPQQHQAMFEAPVPNAPAGTIIQVMNVGFKIGERLLRPAQVGVSSTVMKKPEPAPEPEPEA